MDCFCGCGKKAPRFPLGLRSINKRGAIIFSDVEGVAVLLEGGMISPNGEEFVEEGKRWIGVLAAAVHARQDAGPEVESATRDFMRQGREQFSEAALGKAIYHSGMSYDDTMAALQRGEFDPFA